MSAEELAEWRRDFPNGRRSVEVEHSEFRLADHRAFLAENAAEITTFEARRQDAFDAERAEWQKSGEFDRLTELAEDPAAGTPIAPVVEVPAGTDLIEAPFGGSGWKLMVAEGDEVRAGDVIAVIEAMKMESPLESPGDGTIAALYIRERQALEPGAPMLALRRHL